MKYVFLIVIVIFSSCASPSDDSRTGTFNKGLKDTLLQVMELDQYFRNFGDSLEKQFGPDADTVQLVNRAAQAQDSLNLIIIRSLLDNRGWPSRSTVGDTAVLAPFFVLQHSADAEVMNKYLPLLQAMVESGDLGPRLLAYYTDRLTMLRKQPQVFGTQIYYNSSSGKMELYPVIKPDSLDIRRKSADLGPINSYLRSMGVDTLASD